MATFSRETAKVQEVYYLRRVGPDKIKYERQPFNLITFDDGSGQYIEPAPLLAYSDSTWGDKNRLDLVPEQLILDTPVAFTGVTEIR